MNNCNANRRINNFTEENKQSSSTHFAAVNTNRIAYHTSFSVPDALHNLSSLKSSNSLSWQDSEEPSWSNTMSSTPYSISYENVDSFGERSRVSIERKTLCLK